jgi:hypothetical protein
MCVVNTGEETLIPAYTPVILQLISTNCEEKLKEVCFLRNCIF